MTTPFKFGSEFMVNTTGTGAISSLPDVTALVDGRFVVSWGDFRNGGDDTSGQGIRAQLFHADGSKAGDEFLINTTTSNSQLEPEVAALASNRFAVTWQDQSEAGISETGSEIRAQFFNANGSKIGSEFLVNTTTTNNQSQPEIATLPDGRFAVTWMDTSSTGGDTSGDAIRAQVFDADGSRSGTEFLVNTTTNKNQSDPSIAALADGRFVVTWEDFSETGGDTSGNAIRAQIFNANGSMSGSEFLVNTTTFFGQFQPLITALTGGRFVISWTDDSASGGDTSFAAIRAQVFDADGNKSGTEFLVNSTTLAQQLESAVTALADGRFVASWTDKSATGGDSSGDAIRAQVFDSGGSKSGSEFLVNTQVSGDQLRPSVTLLADGRFVVSWEDHGDVIGSPPGPHIRAQIFDPREAGVNMTGTALADDFIGTKFGDRMKGRKGDDLLLGRDGNDTLSGGLGSDKLNGGRGRDTLDGNSGKDLLVGQNGNDWLTGGRGKDKILGGKGADVLRGDLGKDILTGGDGADRFVFFSPVDSGTGFAKRDMIRDFDQAENDRIVLTKIDGASAAGDQAFTFIGTAAFSSTEGELRYVHSAVNTIVQADIAGDGSADFAVTVGGLHSLTAGDFVL